MKKIKKLALKIISSQRNRISLKKYYKVYRKIQNIINPSFKPIYKILDQKIIKDNREIPVRVFIPKENPLPKLLIFFHGGGWVTGNIDSYTNVCAEMANRTNHTVISIDYRLAPEYPFPIGLEDCYWATREIFLNSEKLNFKQDDITLIGDSAGGNLAAAVSLMARDRGEFLPKRQILIYPSTYHDHSDNSPFPSIIENGKDYILTSKQIQDYMDLYVKDEKDRLNPYVAPLLAEDLSNQPKTLIITAEFDPLRDEGEAYGFKLMKFGNDVKVYRIKNALHGFLSNHLDTNHVDELYEIINLFLKE